MNKGRERPVDTGQSRLLVLSWIPALAAPMAALARHTVIFLPIYPETNYFG